MLFLIKKASLWTSICFYKNRLITLIIYAGIYGACQVGTVIFLEVQQAAASTEWFFK